MKKRSTKRMNTVHPAEASLDHDAILARLRKLALALPDTSETTSFGHPTFQVAGKTFCVYEVYRGELCIVFKAELPVQHALVQGPRFLVAPYIGKHGWTSLRCALGLDWGEIGDLVRESHRLVGERALSRSRRRRQPQPSSPEDGSARGARAAPKPPGSRSARRRGA
jgi:predicted DNA-binding protein (MmcQ/YjbR family)